MMKIHLLGSDDVIDQHYKQALYITVTQFCLEKNMFKMKKKQKKSLELERHSS